MTGKFSPRAKSVWESIAPPLKTQILNTVGCRHCANVTTIVHYTGKVKGGDLILEGECERCGGQVVRLIENE